jgi:predicted nucleic acid-binding Zn ribbon protein
MSSRKRGPEKLADVLAELIVQRGYARQLTASAYTEAWAAVNDPLLAKASRPGNLRRGILEVAVKNSTVMQELTFRKKQILKKLKQQLPDEVIKDIRFRIGNVD